jgi:hypothetical protein
MLTKNKSSNPSPTELMYKLGYTFFSAFGKEGKQKDWNPTSTSSGFLWKLFDLALAFGLIASMWVCMAKGLVSWIKDRHRRTFSLEMETTIPYEIRLEK